MKLNSFEFYDYHKELFGIEKGEFLNLPSLMCLVGKNGSGKSRILNIIKNEIKINSVFSFFESKYFYIKRFRNHSI
jgi:predicted ATP-binding protein involved in virulence